MQIKRNYSEPFFTGRRRKRSPGQRAFVLVLLGIIAAVVVVTLTSFEQLQTAAYDVMGWSPTATPLPSEIAARAADLFRAGNLEGAAAVWTEVVRNRPDNVDYLYEFGQVLVELSRYDEAISLADHAVDLLPNDPRGYALKMRALALSGDYAGAISLGAVALSVDPNFGATHAALARAYTDAARYNEALEHGTLAVENDPFYPDSHRSYAYALTSVRENELAIQELEAAIESHPGLVAAYFELAYQFLALNRDQDAIAVYDRILSFQPRNAKAMLRLCEAYRKIGEFERALGFCQDSVRTDPTFAQGQLQLGIMLYNRLQFSEALAAFEQCYASAPDSLDCLYRIGLAQYYLALQPGADRDAYCEEAWTTLQDSLLMAQTRGASETIGVIREGLTAVTRDCPAYSGQFVVPVENTAPEATESP
jgi:tetratricopeptide (TPR) repeat protein